MLHKEDVNEYYEIQVREVSGDSLPDTSSDKVNADRASFLEQKLGAEVCQAIAWVANWVVNEE